MIKELRIRNSVARKTVCQIECVTKKKIKKKLSHEIHQKAEYAILSGRKNYLSDRVRLHEEDNINLSLEVSDQKKKIEYIENKNAELIVDVSRRKEQIIKISVLKNFLSDRMQLYVDENTNLRYELYGQKLKLERLRLGEENTKLRKEVSCQKEQITTVNVSRRCRDLTSNSKISLNGRWKSNYNMMIESNIFEIDKSHPRGCATATLIKPLEPSNSFIKVKIVSIGKISIGLMSGGECSSMVYIYIPIEA